MPLLGPRFHRSRMRARWNASTCRLGGVCCFALLFFNACALRPRKEQRVKQAEERQEAMAELAASYNMEALRKVPVGEVMAVNTNEGFVVIKPRSLQVNLFVPGSKFEARSGKVVNAELTLGSEHNAKFRIADFKGGTPTIGDLVYFVSPPGPIEPPPL